MQKLSSAFFILFFISLGLVAQEKMEKSVLIVLDLQEASTIYNMNSMRSAALIKNTNEAIGIARPMEVIFIKADMKVISVSLKGIKKEEAEHVDLDGRLTRKIDDRVLTKNKSSAFSVKEFTDYLENEKIRNIYMAGIMLGDCLYVTALDGIDSGYNIHIIEEAVTAKREKKSKKYLNELALSGVKVISLEKFRDDVYY